MSVRLFKRINESGPLSILFFVVFIAVVMGPMITLMALNSQNFTLIWLALGWLGLSTLFGMSWVSVTAREFRQTQ
jgi:hypothetical protein